jgi:hypothetical protein
MTWFKKPDWSAYKRALSRVAETGSKFEMAEAEGAPDLQAVSQQFQEALDAYQTVRTGLVGLSSQQMASEMDGHGAPAEGPAARRARPDRAGGEGFRSRQHG